MSATSNSYKNTYGKRKYRRRYNQNRSRTYKIAQKAARAEIYKNEKKEVEMKSYDLAFVGTQNITNVGLMIPVTPPIPRGTGPNERVGSEVSVKGILARLELQPPASYTTHYMVRIIAFRWNASGTPSAANVLQFVASNDAPLSPLVRDASHKFQVLYDNLFHLGADSEPAARIEKFYLQKLGTAVWDDSNVPQKGQVFLLYISDGSVEIPNVRHHVRVRYTDQ